MALIMIAMWYLYHREYGRIVIGTPFIAAFFSGGFLILLILAGTLLVSSSDTILAKTGTLASITGVFLGTYIATWLSNQNRTRAITENFFYKTSLLIHTRLIVESILVVLSHIESLQANRIPDEFQKLWKAEKKECEHNINRIAAINANMHVPAHTRGAVEVLIRHAVKSFGAIRASDQTRVIMVDQFLLHPLDRIIESDYVVNDSSKQVQEQLKHVKCARAQIHQLINQGDTVRDTIQ